MEADLTPEEKKESQEQIRESEIKRLIQEDTSKLATYTKSFLESVYPSYSVTDNDAVKNLDLNTRDAISNMSFFKVCSCTIEESDDIATFFQYNMGRLMTSAYSLGIKICFGIIGRENDTALILGLDPQKVKQDTASNISTIQGILPGISLQEYKFASSSNHENSWWGMMEAIPSPQIDGESQKIDYSGMMRSLHGHEYNFFIVAQPIPQQIVQQKISAMLAIQTQCSSILKRNFSIQKSNSRSNSESTTHQDGSSLTVNGAGLMALVGAGVGGACAGLSGIMFGAGLGAALGSSCSFSKNKSVSIAETISKSVSETYGQNFDVQNFFAKELMDYAEASTERLKKSLANGCWETTITYSAQNASTINQIQGAIYGDVAKPNTEILPPRVQKFNYSELTSIYKVTHPEQCEIFLPKSFYIDDYKENKISAPLTSQELAMLMALPEASVPGFELRKGKFYSFANTQQSTNKEERLGCVCECERIIENEFFGLDNRALNKHTFVSGITGCGKTNTVKRILKTANVPFLVIECAKKEYRHLDSVKGTNILTPGHTELHSPRFNPFYIQAGISLQTHIDYLKDLFNASFAFYGPMTYILETCLHRIYQKKGWNLTTGDHHMLVNRTSFSERYNRDIINKSYSVWEHRLLFPTMTDLQSEVKSYIETELQYEGEVAGNIRSAMKARLENLCIGAKGYMLDTNEPIDMQQMLSENTVIELEGLADDSDKAFAVGLLIIFINEYRQASSDETDGLRHLLVIEEAHRLLKNVSMERNNESIGNPKGKAVEHFTNILAEMRSYGQGVIIAEQIPSKITPDVIKNSSNKIIHRLVSKDDQEFLANTIGMNPEEAIFMGTLRPGYALCHKEGMYNPVLVKVDWREKRPFSDNDIREAACKNNTSPAALIEHQVRTKIPVDIDRTLFKLLNNLMCHASDFRNNKIPTDEKAIKEIENKIRILVENCCQKSKAMKIAEASAIKAAIVSILSEKLVASFCHGGGYAKENLPEYLYETFQRTLLAPAGMNAQGDRNNTIALIDRLAQMDTYGDLVYNVVSEAAISSSCANKGKGIIPHKLLQSYFFISPPSKCITEINSRIMAQHTATKKGNNND